MFRRESRCQSRYNGRAILDGGVDVVVAPCSTTNAGVSASLIKSLYDIFRSGERTITALCLDPRPALVTGTSTDRVTSSDAK